MRYNVIKVSKQGRKEVLVSDLSEKFARELKITLESLAREEDADYPYTIELEETKSGSQPTGY